MRYTGSTMGVGSGLQTGLCNSRFEVGLLSLSAWTKTITFVKGLRHGFACSQSCFFGWPKIKPLKLCQTKLAFVCMQVALRTKDSSNYKRSPDLHNTQTFQPWRRKGAIMTLLIKNTGPGQSCNSTSSSLSRKDTGNHGGLGCPCLCVIQQPDGW